MDSFYELREIFQKEGIIFSYSGILSHSLMESMGESLKCKLIDDDINPSQQRKLFSVFVEKIQNIINYSQERTPKDAMDSSMAGGIITVGNKDEKYYLVGVNKIDNSSIDVIKEKIEHINSLDKDGLKKLYKEARRAGPSTENSKGAGIGFIEIARKAILPLEYHFDKIDEQYSYFLLKTNV